MSDRSDNKPVSANAASPIRRIGKDEQHRRPEQRRAWPDKKHLASEQNIPLPKPGEKNRIHSVLVALPVIMLIIGLFVYFHAERKQNNGEPVLSEMVSREGEFKSLSEVSGIGTPKHYLWYTSENKSRGVRITAQQRDELSELSSGDALTLNLVPRLSGSSVLWAYQIENNGRVLVDVSAE